MATGRLARQCAQWCAARLNVRSEAGATAVEYGIMVALIAAVIIAAVFVIGQNTKSKFSCVGSAIGNAPNSSDCG